MKILSARGLNFFDEREVFRLCSRRIREENYEEDEFLTYLCIELFRRGQYDKTTLLYLADYYYGATADMKRLWKALREYGIPSDKLGERIITQMVFTEDMFGEEKIFEDYYLSRNVYFRIRQAYLAFVSREYVVRERKLDPCIFEMIANDCEKKERSAGHLQGSASDLLFKPGVSGRDGGGPSHDSVRDVREADDLPRISPVSGGLAAGSAAL